MARIPLDQDPNACEMVIATNLGAAKVSEQQILSQVEQCCYSEVSRFAIKLALEEAITNAIKHGNHNDPTKRITIRFRVTPEEAVIWLTDEGAGFNPDGVPDPTLDENLGKPNGRGIMLMRAYMDEVSFGKCGREVRLVKLNRA
jgi:serine/threonine-protein kinase RsbW